ncbi:MAG: hypothetical protein H7319_12760 [Spirosoma sp.]|nr:hypothetical protein [Spirosoma sp.]
MQVQVDIDFNQLVQIIRTLPAEQLSQLKAEIENKTIAMKPKTRLETLLLKGPVATKDQVETIDANRKAINGGQRNSARHLYSD